ncbi:hypothetical protein Tco_0873929 [Tanacetum coccineum]|uniref:Uncharacterized protein n=1 Tax=Tanacetum coccineum TaxID=301880 RepID=A0ABQ5BN44_9ASTR
MANIRTCNKHNMIACVEKTAQNADFYQIIDFLTGCSINYSLLVDLFLLVLASNNFGANASLKVIIDVPPIAPRDIGYEGNLAQLTFSKPLFSPQWKYLVHVLLHCLSPKRTSWEQFGTNIASALVGLATNQKFNFSLLIMNGMLGHISNEVVTALAAEEEHSTSPHSKAASSARDAQGTPTQSAAHSQRTASFPWIDGVLKHLEEMMGTYRYIALDWGSDETDEVNIEEKELYCKEWRTEDWIWRQLKVLLDKVTLLKGPKILKIIAEFEIPGSHTNSNLKATQGLRITTYDEEVARKIQAEWDADEAKKRGKLYDKVQASIKDSFKDFIPMDSEKEREMLKERDAKRLSRKRKATIAEEQPSKKPKQDLYHLYRVVDDYYEHIPPTGLGLMLLGDLNIIWETAESSDDDFWKDQEEWEIIRWRFHESSGVHTLELERHYDSHDGLKEDIRYHKRAWMMRMLEHGMEVEDCMK